jgi:hypothetical protein
MNKDQFLLNQGVLFLPWIGQNYEQGFADRRLLVLGESHYDKWTGEKHELANSFTRECIQEVVNREGGANFWKYLEQALLNEARQSGWAPSGGGVLWDKLSFYNFVQSPVSGGGTHPAKSGSIRRIAETVPSSARTIAAAPGFGLRERIMGMDGESYADRRLPA